MTTMRNKRLTTIGLAGLVFVLFLVLSGTLANAAPPPLPVTLNPLNAAHRQLLEPMFGTPLTIRFDPQGSAVFYMGTELAAIPNDTYTNIRYVLFPYEDVADHVLTLESRGGDEGSGNPSHYLIYGWEDYKNYHYVYVAESTATRISRVVDGKHQDIYNHGELIWVRDRGKYQEIKIDLGTVDGERVLNTYVNGELAMSYTFTADQEPPPGKVGIGMWNLTHSAYLKNISLAEK